MYLPSSPVVVFIPFSSIVTFTPSRAFPSVSVTMPLTLLPVASINIETTGLNLLSIRRNKPSL